MSSELSVAQVLANLEAQMAFHKEREEHHARQEALHGEQRAFHAAEHATVAQAHEAFKASAGGAAEIAARAVASAPEALPPLETVPLNATLPSRLVARAVAEIPTGETFSPSRVAAEVNQRFRAELKKPIDSRQASTTLRRLQAEGVVRLIRKGMPHHEALYVRS